MIIEEYGKVQVDQRVGTGTHENMELISDTHRVRNSTFEGKHVEWTHSSIITACSYALVAFSTSSKLVRATIKKDTGLLFTPSEFTGNNELSFSLNLHLPVTCRALPFVGSG